MPPAPTRTILDWRRANISATPQPCVLCGDPTLVLSPRGVPCHKSCAEHWIDEHRVVNT